MDFPQVLDFGDGTTYTLPVSNAREQENNQPQAGEMQQIQEQPVSKAERFATDDFDRSWPPKAPHGFASQERRRSNDHQHSNDHLASTRTLYNARLNKMEPSHERPAPASAEPAPRTQILPRSTKDGTSGAPALATRSEKQPSQQPLERQISRERPWGRVQPPVIGAERNPWGKRRPSESEHGRTWGPPHAVGEGQAWPRADDQNARSPPGHQAPLAPLFSQTQSISAVLSPPPVAPAAISPAIDITELQKDEMHRAAEQARLRRQQEEAEREAQKERARKKAEEIAAREAQRAQSKSSVQQPRSETPHIRKQDEIALEKPRASVPRIDALHQPAIRNPPAIGTRRPSEKRVAFEDPVPVQATSRIESARRPPAGPGSSAVPATSGVRQEADVSRIANAFAGSPPSIVSPNNQHFSAFFDPLAESDHLPTTELHYNDLSSLSNEARTAESPEARKVAIPGAVDRFNLRPELLQAESWRKSTRGQEVIVPGVIGSSREQRAPQRILLQKPLPPPVPDTPQTMEELAWSPPDHVKVALPPQQAQSPLPDTNVGSAFDTVLARLQHAMSTPNEQHQYRPQGDSERESYTGIQAAEITDLSEAHMESEIRLSYTSLPRPQDFVLSTIPLPPSPGPAWKRYTIRLPRDPAIEKPYPARSQNSHLRAAVPPGWILSWDPPLEQLGPRNLSREDWLMPKSYHRGKLVTTVRLPSGSFQPYVRTQGDVRPGEASAITSQAIKDEAHKSGSKKIVVRLPTGNFPSRGGNGEASGAAETLSVREEFQTSSDIPSLSPVSSSEDLPSTAHADHHVNDAAAARKAARKVPEGVAIAFARPHGNSFSEDGDAKSSVRFMVSSEIEDDNLLSEVNKMSMDGLLDNPAAEESQGLGLETEPRVSKFAALNERVIQYLFNYF
jgi:serine/arginine repetitive matrix protein 2